MADKNYNDENLAKLTEEFSKNKKNSNSNNENDLFKEFFGQKSDRQNSVTKDSFTPINAQNGSSVNSDEDFDHIEDDEKQPSSKAVRKKTGIFSGFMYFVFIVSVSIILACVGWMAASDVLALNKEVITAEISLPTDIFTKESRTVEKSDGSQGTETYYKANMGKVAQILKENGIIEYKSLFLLYASVSDANVKLDPGTYELSTIYDYRAIVKKMQFGSGAMVTTQVTFPEGTNLKDAFKLLQENKVCTYDELMECAASMDFGYSFLVDLPYGDASRLEGYLFPETYEFYQGATAQGAIDTFLQIFNAKVTAEMRDKAGAMGYSLHQIITIASMIEKEAANDEERANIASVIYNRLKQDMPLQIDATIQYILPEVKEKLSTEDTKIESPYNTYLNKGLPAGPISNPGLPSIKAALNPATTRYLYYALDEASNTHKFFTSYNEFEAFKATQSYGQ